VISTKVSRVACVGCMCVLVAVAPRAGADDARGQYAVRGAGLISCGLYMQQRSTQGDIYLMTAAWVDGYVTGVNQHSADTYDVLPFEGAELLMSILDNHCKDHPKDPVFGVLNSLFQKLWPGRLTQRSEKTAVVVGERKIEIYTAIIVRMQQALHALGLYDGPANGAFSEQTGEALKRYQTSIGFDPSGFPDQMTVWRLLIKET
jgi:hypothetical protein